MIVLSIRTGVRIERTCRCKDRPDPPLGSFAPTLHSATIHVTRDHSSLFRLYFRTRHHCSALYLAALTDCLVVFFLEWTSKASWIDTRHFDFVWDHYAIYLLPGSLIRLRCLTPEDNGGHRVGRDGRDSPVSGLDQDHRGVCLTHGRQGWLD